MHEFVSQVCSEDRARRVRSRSPSVPVCLCLPLRGSVASCLSRRSFPCPLLLSIHANGHLLWSCVLCTTMHLAAGERCGTTVLIAFPPAISPPAMCHPSIHGVSRCRCVLGWGVVVLRGVAVCLLRKGVLLRDTYIPHRRLPLGLPAARYSPPS